MSDRSEEHSIPNINCEAHEHTWPNPDVFRHPDSMLVASQIMEAVPAMIAVFGRDLRYIYANRRYMDTVNSEQPTWRGRTLTEYLPEYLHEHVIPRIKRVTEEGEHVSYYLEITPADMIMRTILINYFPIPNVDGNTEFFIKSGLDATELKIAEQRLFSAQKLETIGQLTGGIAHDFNNQMAIIIGILSLIKMEISDDKQLAMLQTLEEAANKCTES